MQRSILCVKHAKFLTSHMPIFEYQTKPEFLLLDIVLIVKTFGGEASPLHPQVDETLVIRKGTMYKRMKGIIRIH